MSVASIEVCACFRSVRDSSAFATATSTFTESGEKGALSVGSIFTVQKSADAGSKMSARSVSSARSMAASATITASSRWATSASASTMSIGAMVPISTRALLFLSDSRARSSDWRVTASDSIA